MKQTIILLTGFLLATTLLCAQGKQPHFITELSAGASFPIGKFADKSFRLSDKKQAGMAQTGWAANASVGYYLNRSAGLLLSVGYSDHKTDMSRYAQGMGGPAIDPLPPANLWYSGKSWKEVNVRAGAFFVVPLTADHRLELVPKLTAGICKTAVPGYDWKVLRDDGTVSMEGTDEKLDLPWGFCYQADVQLKYRLGNHLYVSLNATSFNAIPQKDFQSGVSPYFYGGKRQFNMNMINALAGIGIDF